ncbi:dehydrogenase [Oleiphilus sp. HI0061]|uniref:PQQ-dependent sugar dehydrogenase n=3 Tax=Oleiphilus sp. HI0061 TaxID=1822239 RepID=UPI0007CFF32C|nr:PQQ-dependent sugar dehydrogenase [Oleiphilus sp. HI0061]KZY58593.1 dehydrogenase [Oleiphilus sp. HI0061]
MYNFIACISLAFFISFASPSFSRTILEGQSGQIHFILEELYSGLNIPWGLAFLDANTLLITERRGRLYSLDIQTKQLTTIQGLKNVLAKGQGGLLDIAISPTFSSSKNIYLSYSKRHDGKGTTALASAQLTENQQLRHWRELFVAKGDSDTFRHFGSRIAFDNQGHIFFSVGDRGKREDAQNLSNHAGSIIRLNLDGTVPKDNPFTQLARALPEIWSYGHRNPQGLAFTPDKSVLWSIEHGPRGGDEINLIKPGKNYGWPIISYGKEYWGPISVGESTHKEGMEQPVKYYVPSIAPGSLIVYSGNAFKEWKGDLFSGALKMTHLNRVSLNKQYQAIAEERLLESLGERIRAVVESPEGWIYLSTDSGRILRLRDK